MTFWQSVLDPAGPQAAHIHWLWTVMLWVTSVVTFIVLGALTAAVVRGRRRSAAPRSPHEAGGDARDQRLTWIVTASVLATIVILVGLLIASVATGAAMQSIGADSAVSIAIRGHQWWWEVEYEDAVPSRRVKTANEIHVPVGEPVAFKVTSSDVIHSFWVPNLDGKRDLVPGYTTAVWMQADRPGVFRGQCAEFCGRQHAHMAFVLVAESRADYDAWLDRERRSATPPDSDAARRGQAVFMNRQCVACHTIRGTVANGLYGPDLTHIASRRTLAAGTLPNTRDHLTDWIVNPQSTKPGNLMPPNVLPDAEVDDLVTYLETLR